MRPATRPVRRARSATWALPRPDRAATSKPPAISRTPPPSSATCGDPFGEARALGNLGFVRQWQGRYQEAADYHRQALGLCRRIGDRAGEAYALARLGCVDLRLGECQHAAGYLRQALALFQRIGSTAGQAEILARLGDAYLGLGRHKQATGHFEQALAMSREIG